MTFTDTRAAAADLLEAELAARLAHDLGSPTIPAGGPALSGALLLAFGELARQHPDDARHVIDLLRTAPAPVVCEVI